MAWTQTTNIRGASGTPGASGAVGATGPTGATGPIGATGGTGGTGAQGSNYSRVVTTITSATTLGASGSTDYVTFISATENPVTTQLLLHADGSNNSTSVVDSSASPKTLTVVGDAKISTAESKFGGSSFLFDGAGDGLTMANPNTQFGAAITGDFTVEMWVRWISVPSGSAGGLERNLIGQVNQPEGNSGNWWAFFGVSTGLQFYICNSTFDLVTGSFTWSANTWYHVAGSRSGSTLRLYIDGTQVGSGTTSKSIIADNTRALVIGADIGADALAMNGYVDELRISSTALYTSAFTPSTTAFTNPSTGRPTLPAASGALGRYSFRNISGVSTTIGASGAQAINGATGALSLSNGSSVELMSNGSGWFSF